jgi:hypothetical protein
MIPYAILGALLGLPLLLGLIFKVSTSHVFFTLMASELLAHYFGADVGTIVHSVVRHELVIEYAEVVILIVPLFLTALFLKGTIAKGRLLLHLLPLLITGVVLAAFALPMLPTDAQTQIRTVQAGQELLDMTDAIIGAVVFVQLISLWLLNRAHGEGHSGKKHHHVG